MSFDPLSMGWLPRPSNELRSQIRAIDRSDLAAGSTLQRLAMHRLDIGMATLLGRALLRLQENGTDLSPLRPFRLTILSNATVDLIADALPAAALRHGIALELVRAPYDQILQQALDPNSEVNLAGSDATLLAVDHRWLGLDAPDFDVSGLQNTAIESLSQVCDAISCSTRRPIILQTLTVPPLSQLGSYDRLSLGSSRSMIESVNNWIVERCRRDGNFLLDVAALAEQVGTARWHDPLMWNLYKLPMSTACIPLYADWIGRVLGANRGNMRKCLVLDLDNTLWGGVVGDDGIEGLRLGPGSAEGEAFLTVQRYALQMKDRGIVLAISSKNNDDVARAAFDSHPEMLLKSSDVAVFQANWEDKASNLEAIASTLNIGIDALVFLDDNGAERAQVRAAIPSVAVPELPSDPAEYVLTLAAAGYFETTSLSSEDFIRAKSYAANAERAELRTKTRNIGDYLSSLEMEIDFSSFDMVDYGRITQLINKSNQFNLTTRRYSEAEVAKFGTQSNIYTQQVRLEDKFGKFGMIGVIICRTEGESTWHIDTWLMSCRVLGRMVEEAMLSELVSAAKRHGVECIYGYYIPTEKNSMVSKHFDRLSFERIDKEKRSNHAIYKLDVGVYIAAKLPFRKITSASVF